MSVEMPASVQQLRDALESLGGSYERAYDNLQCMGYLPYCGGYCDVEAFNTAVVKPFVYAMCGWQTSPGEERLGSVELYTVTYDSEGEHRQVWTLSVQKVLNDGDNVLRIV